MTHSFPTRRSSDLLYFDGQSFHEFTSIRVDTKNTHGTGCTFASAIAAGLAKGMRERDAVALAKSYVTLAIQHAYPIGQGHGPVHHFYRRSEEHTSELQSLMRNSYAVFCLKK